MWEEFVVTCKCTDKINCFRDPSEPHPPPTAPPPPPPQPPNPLQLRAAVVYSIYDRIDNRRTGGTCHGENFEVIYLFQDLGRVRK